jgi:hypothetical protein
MPPQQAATFRKKKKKKVGDRMKKKSKEKKKYLSQGCTHALRRASGRTHPLFKGMLKHLSRSNSNLMSKTE